MGRYTGPACRRCRRSGMKLYLKGIRCETPKCAMERPWRSKPPGQYARKHRSRQSPYGLRLREKQKLRWYYGVLERQFRKYFGEASHAKASTGEVLLSLMERRLDNVVYRLGFAASRPAARQLVCHGHVAVNGRRVNLASFRVKQGDRIAVCDDEDSQNLARACLEQQEGRVTPQWLSLNTAAMEAVIAALPGRDDVSLQINEQLIVELCSR